jgi:hypothetical protein
MEITRNVILDLLPLYLADEVSADTKALVDRYLKEDPGLADIARESAAMELPADAPFPLTQEDMMNAYKEAKRFMFWRTIILAAIISFSSLAILALGVIAAAYFIG